MCRIKAQIVRLDIQNECIASFQTARGIDAEVVMPPSVAKDGYITVVEICRENDRVLIELPGETTRGYRRIWVSPGQVYA
jgi:hypothetical protein